MIVNCKYLFVKPDGETVSQSLRWSPALFMLHLYVGNTIVEVAEIGGKERIIKFWRNK